MHRLIRDIQWQVDSRSSAECRLNQSCKGVWIHWQGELLHSGSTPCAPWLPTYTSGHLCAPSTSIRILGSPKHPSRAVVVVGELADREYWAAIRMPDSADWMPERVELSTIAPLLLPQLWQPRRVRSTEAGDALQQLAGHFLQAAEHMKSIHTAEHMKGPMQLWPSRAIYRMVRAVAERSRQTAVEVLAEMNWPRVGALAQQLTDNSECQKRLWHAVSPIVKQRGERVSDRQLAAAGLAAVGCLMPLTMYDEQAAVDILQQSWQHCSARHPSRLHYSSWYLSAASTVHQWGNALSQLSLGQHSALGQMALLMDGINSQPHQGLWLCLSSRLQFQQLISHSVTQRATQLAQLLRCLPLAAHFE